MADSPVTHRNLQVIGDSPADLGDLSGDLDADLGEQVTDANGDGDKHDVNPSSHSVSPTPEPLTSDLKDGHSDPQADKQDPEPVTCDSCGENFSDELELVNHVCSQVCDDVFSEKIQQKCGRKSQKSKTKQTTGKKGVGKPRKSLESQDGTPAKETEPRAKVKVKKEKGSPTSGEKKLVMCEVCGKAFPSESKLKIHSYTHTDAEKPYK